MGTSAHIDTFARDHLPPVELQPLIVAMNELMARISKGEQAQQNFMADVAHQLRTPLTGLKLQLELLHDKHQDQPDTARSLAMMNSSVERMIRQSRQLLALARSEPGLFESRKLEELSLHKLVEESVQHFIEEADKKQIDLGFDLQPARLRGDRFLLADLIDNLIDNAVKYGKRASVSIEDRAEAVNVVIEDEGQGMEPQDMERMFKPFQRLERSRNRETGGIGLGLAIARGIARARFPAAHLCRRRRLLLLPALGRLGRLAVGIDQNENVAKEYAMDYARKRAVYLAIRKLDIGDASAMAAAIPPKEMDKIIRGTTVLQTKRVGDKTYAQITVSISGDALRKLLDIKDAALSTTEGATNKRNVLVLPAVVLPEKSPVVWGMPLDVKVSVSQL